MNISSKGLKSRVLDSANLTLQSKLDKIFFLNTHLLPVKVGLTLNPECANFLS